MDRIRQTVCRCSFILAWTPDGQVPTMIIFLNGQVEPDLVRWPPDRGVVSVSAPFPHNRHDNLRSASASGLPVFRFYGPIDGALFLTRCVSRKTPFPGGGELPKQYADAMDPFVVLAAAANATKTIKLGTGVLLVQQRDTIQTAKLVASIDQVSQGCRCSRPRNRTRFCRSSTDGRS